jgi:preprotein translocase subunit SecA
MNRFNLDIKHLKELHGKLTPEDFARIKGSYKAMQKIEELKNEVNNMEDSELQQDIEELLEDLEDKQN